MKIITARKVELTNEEAHVKRMFEALLNQGHDAPTAVNRIKELHPAGMDPAFYRWLAGESPMPTDKVPAIYKGPFDPPPAFSMEGAIGWRFVRQQIGGNQWRPVAWEIVKPDGILTVDYHTKLATRDSIIYAP